MAELNISERKKIEDFFEMKSGYFPDFTDRAFQEFVSEVTGKDILSSKYNIQGDSKANRLRAFMQQESNYEVGILLEKLIEFAMVKYKPGDLIDNDSFEFYESCLKIAKKLKDGDVVNDPGALQPNNIDTDFKLLAKSIRESVDKDELEVALDRLHTFLVKYIRTLCNTHGIKFDKTESLNAVFGKYVKYLTSNKLVDSVMSEKFLMSSINVIEAFNDIRNFKSAAYDNPTLNHSERILIFNTLTNSIKFIQSIENKNKPVADEEKPADWDSLPY